MAFAKRILLFMAVNILVVVTLSITLQVLGVRPYLSARGIDYQALMMFCLVWGMGGAFISLGLSRVMAKWSMGVRVIDPAPAVARQVARLLEKAGMRNLGPGSGALRFFTSMVCSVTFEPLAR